jgi:hypothetical protein
MIVCEVVLYDGPEQNVDWKGRMWFRRVPVRGETIVLKSADGSSDWPEELHGSYYTVASPFFRQGCPEDRNPPPPGIPAFRQAKI